MSYKMRRAIEVLYSSIKANSADIEKKLHQAGINTAQAQALVFSAAKYFEALNKLAEE